MNKLKLIVLSIIAILAQEEEAVVEEDGPKTNCLNCKLLDSESTFLVSQSYCAATDECL